jgi:hypothetical protein
MTLQYAFFLVLRALLSANASVSQLEEIAGAGGTVANSAASGVAPTPSGAAAAGGGAGGGQASGGEAAPSSGKARGEDGAANRQSPLVDSMITLITRNDEEGIRKMFEIGASVYGKDRQERSLVEIAHEHKCSFFLEEVLRRARLDNPWCVVCMQNDVNVFFLPCMHLVVCSVCEPLLKRRCPTCRANVTSTWTCDNGPASFRRVLSADASGSAK